MVIISSHRQWFSYRGLAPHQFMPMLGVHKALHRTRCARAVNAALYALGLTWYQ